MRLRGLNTAEPSELLDTIERSLNEIANCLAAAASEVGNDGDVIAQLAADTARLIPVIEILREWLRWRAFPSSVAVHRGGPK